MFWIIGACGAAAFLNACINLRQAATRTSGRLDLRAIPAGYQGIFANPRAKFCFAAVFLEGVAVFGLFPFVALILVTAGEPRASVAGIVIGGFSIAGVVYSLLVRLLTRRWQPRSLMIGGGAISALAFLVIAANPPWPLQLAAFLILGIGFYSLHGCIQVEATELSVSAAARPPHCTPRSFSWGTRPDPCSMASRSRNWGAAPPWPSGAGSCSSSV